MRLSASWHLWRIALDPQLVAESPAERIPQLTIRVDQRATGLISEGKVQSIIEGAVIRESVAEAGYEEIGTRDGWDRESQNACIASSDSSGPNRRIRTPVRNAFKTSW